MFPSFIHYCSIDHSLKGIFDEEVFWKSGRHRSGIDNLKLWILRCVYRQQANQAVVAAVASCLARGYKTTASVVNPVGKLIAMLRGDGATPSTLDSSRF